MKVNMVREAGAILPERKTQGSFGYDIAILDEVTIAPFETAKVRTGLRLAKPLYMSPGPEVKGIALLMTPRSSTILRWGVMIGNTPAIIDADYIDEEIQLLLHNVRLTPITIPAHTAVAQAVFVQMVCPDICEVEEISAFWLHELGTRGGFGSTG